jgi:hypothetical protein
MHKIADDLNGHSWYLELVWELLDEVEAYLAHWAAFADYLGEPVL